MKNKLKSAAIFTAIVCLCCFTAGCKGMGNGKKSEEVFKAQDEVLSLESGKLIVISEYENDQKSESIKSELVFKKLSSGKLSYCQTQFDNAGKVIYCDFANAEQSRQWFIGKGWSDIADPEYSDQNPHRFMRALTKKQEKDCVKTIETTETDDGMKVYTMLLNPKALNETSYKEADFNVISETIEVTVDKKGLLCSYDDIAVLEDKSTSVSTKYGLRISLSEAGMVNEITPPELREYSKTTDAEVEEK